MRSFNTVVSAALCNRVFAVNKPVTPHHSASFSQADISFPQPGPDAVYGTGLEIVHELYEDFATGVAVTKDGRIFLAMPRFTPGRYVPITLAVATNFTREAAYPNLGMQTCKPGETRTCLINVQSVVIDSLERLWALDVGIPTDSKVVVGPHAAKLMVFNTTSDTLIDTYALPPEYLGPGININDVRFDLTLGTQGYAFLADEGSSLFVLNLATRQWRRRLFDTPPATVDGGFVGTYNGSPFYLYNTTLQTRSFLRVGVNGIALTGGYLYWGMLSSRRLHRVPIALLIDYTVSDDKVLAAVEFLGQAGSYLTGFTSDSAGRVYMGAPEQNAIFYFNTTVPDDKPGTLSSASTPASKNVVHPENLVIEPFIRSSLITWPDSMCVQSGYLWFSTNQLPLLPQFQPDNKSRQIRPFGIYRVPIISSTD